MATERVGRATLGRATLGRAKLGRATLGRATPATPFLQGQVVTGDKSFLSFPSPHFNHGNLLNPRAKNMLLSHTQGYILMNPLKKIITPTVHI